MSNNNTRCISVIKSDVFPDGLIKFKTCIACPFSSEGKVTNYYFCEALKYYIADEKMSILPDCPAPFYDDVRKHGPDEVPKDNSNVLLTFDHRDDEGNSDLFTVSFFYKWNSWDEAYDNNPILGIHEMVYWEYLIR